MPWPLVLLAACQGPGDDGPVIVDLVGKPDELVTPLRHDRQIAAQTVLGATAQGLVAFDAQGEVVGGLAESWIGADQGQSFIFRLGQRKWPDGSPIRAETVAALLQERMRASPDLMAGLTPQVRAMTDRVIEIRLATALPSFLQLLAQPRMGLMAKSGGTGPYKSVLHRPRLYLSPAPGQIDADEDDAPAEPQPRDRRTLEAARAALAVARFQSDEADLVLGGRFQDLLLIPHARLGTTEVRADPAPGLFGLAIVGKSAFLADRGVRDALSRAVDRGALARALNLQGWTTTETPLPAQLDLARPPSSPNWVADPMAERAGAARVAIDGWRASHGAPPILRIALPAGAGANLLFLRLASDYGRIGVQLDRVGSDETADLQLIDAVAAFDSALWYLSQLDCAAGVPCTPDASAALAEARTAPSLAQQAEALSRAEALTVSYGGYIPLGLPIRWSLVSRRLTGFAPSPRGIHPLNRLIAQPN